jgi:predicted  nucleic acid-binding Zn-ribbon protein
VSEDLTISILREIRDEIRSTRQDLGSRIDATNSRLDATNSRLEQVEIALRDLAGQQLLLARYVKNVVDRHEQAIDDLRDRLLRLELKLGG